MLLYLLIKELTIWQEMILMQTVAPEGLKKVLKGLQHWWNNYKYAVYSPYLRPNIYKWTRNRREDIFIARL